MNHQRGCGILMPLACLPGSHGIGDLGSDAYRLVDMLVAAGQKYWQLLPLNPGIPESGESPYFSTSAFAGNPLLISLDLLARQGIVDSAGTAAADSPPDRIDYGSVRAGKEPKLNEAYRTFAQSPDPRFAAFCEEHRAWLDDFALFSAIKRAQGGTSWSQWPAPLRYRDSHALASIREELAAVIEEEKFRQFIFFRQWFALKSYANARGLTLIGDIPIYVNYDSADVWANPGMFHLDSDLRPLAVSGVPPDYFSATGQLWNNPVYSWKKLEESGFQWWVARMRAVFSRFDIVRIDHFRGLVQYWEIPAGEKTAVKGAWRNVPTYAFLDTLLSVLGTFPVIAEDLGTITPDVTEAMQRYGFPGMKVLQFAFGEDDPCHPYLPHMYERNCAVYTGTHDNTTLRGWWETEACANTRGRVHGYLGGERPTEETLWELIRVAAMSVADIAVIPMQDTLMLDGSARINDPGRTFGNWRWRLTNEQMDRFPTQRLKSFAVNYGR